MRILAADLLLAAVIYLIRGDVMKTLEKIDGIVAGALKVFVTALCVGIAIILFIRVIIRFTPLMIPLSWTDEVVEWMMAWMIFTTAALIMRSGEHFRVDLLQLKLEGKLIGHILNVGISLLGIVFFAVLLYYSWDLLAKATQFSPILKVSTRLPYASIPVNCVLILCYLFRDVVKEISRIGRRKKEK